MIKYVVEMNPNLHLYHAMVLQRLVEREVFDLKTEVRVLDLIIIHNCKVLIDQWFQLVEDEVHEKDWEYIKDYDNETNLLFVQL